MDQDDALAQVVMVTNTTPEKAQQYLQLADGDADQAVTLFFENGGADLVDHPPSTTAHSEARSRATDGGQSHNPIAIDPDEEKVDNSEPQITGSHRISRSQMLNSHGNDTAFEDDAAMARRLQEEIYGGSGGIVGNGEEQIRAPVARQTETLLGPGADIMGFTDAEIPSLVERRMRDLQHRRAGRPGIFNQQPVTSNIWNADEVGDRDLLARSTGGASEAGSKSGMLARLFQPPWDLMFTGSWEEAREGGREQKKWLLVNIQNGSVFDCQALNRDLWKNPSVAETVKENFLFLQYSFDDLRAEQYLQYYFPLYDNPDLYPHIAIVDPRTGEQVKVWSRETPKAPEFLMQIHEFLDRYSLNNNVRNPVAKRKPEKKKGKELDTMTEDEQIEAALQASLAHQTMEKSPIRLEDPDDLTRSIGDLRANGKASAPGSNPQDPIPILEEEDEAPQAVLASPFSLIPSNRTHEEPPAGANVTRIQFRHPAGRIIRRFHLDDPVARIYEWLKSEPLEGKEGAEFELVSLGKNLMDSREDTIEQAGLKNGTVMIEFLEA